MGFDYLMTAFAEAAAPEAVLFICAGIIIGFTFGAIPGLGGVIALALILPFTYSMEPLQAIYLAGGIMGATSFGGSISAILLKVPGTAPNAATTYDGFPMAEQGRAGEALGASAAASTLGGLFGLITLCAIIPFSKTIILAFGPGELMLIAILAFVAIASATEGNAIRALIAAAFGLFLATIGYENITGETRFTFGSTYLWDGIPMVPALTGIFVLAPMFWLARVDGSIDRSVGSKNKRMSGLGAGIRSTLANWTVVLRGSVIGTIIGILPGVGGTVASLLAYATAKSVSSEPETFGRAFDDLYGDIIEYYTDVVVGAVDADANLVSTSIGEFSGDVVNVIPQHQAARLPLTMGLTDSSGWAPNSRCWTRRRMRTGCTSMRCRRPSKC